jgi:competence protein ComEA
MEQIRNAYDSISNWWFDLHYSSNQKRGLLVLSALLLIISFFIVARGNAQPPEVEMSSPVIVQEVEIFVDIAGAVNNPGVYSLSAKSRVIDAIKAAGDSAPGADLSTINLARIVSDGEQIYVDSASTSKSYGIGNKNVRVGPVNLNRATKSQLDSLDGIGPVIAQRIIDYRKVNGPFLTIDDIQKVSGIGTAKFTQIKSKIQV